MGKKFYFWLSDMEYETVKEVLMNYCAEKGCPLSNVFREALFDFVKRYKESKEKKKKEEELDEL